MNAGYIFKKLTANLDNRYELCNSYVFRWESDYFGISKSGLVCEIEIKVTRSDFFADFKKVDKHKMLELGYGGKTMATRRGRLNCSYEYLSNNRWSDPKWILNKNTSTSDYDIEKKEGIRNVVKHSTKVHFAKIIIPHRFIYACPEGMIKKNEVPPYAGLFWISEKGDLTKVKMGPILHRSKLDLKKILLDKFYYENLNLSRENQFLKDQNKELRELDGDYAEYIANGVTQPEFDF